MDLSQAWGEYFDLFVRTAERFGLGTAAAEDVIQDLAIEAIGRESNFKDEEHFKLWALRVIRHRAIDYLTSNLPINLGSQSEQLPAAETTHKEPSEYVEFIRGIMEKLPPRQLELVERLQAGESTRQIASAMQITQASARSLKRHAMNFIRSHSEHYFGEKT